jgi:chromosomal replication initiator protein
MSMSTNPLPPIEIPRFLLGRRPTMRAARQILELVCLEFGFTAEQLLNKDRHRSIAEARQIAVWLLRTSRGLSYPEIGLLLQRDHTTIMSNYRSIERRMKKDHILNSCVQRLLIECGTRAPDDGMIDDYESGRHG